MTGDPRLLPSNGRVALEGLRGQIEAARFVAGTPAVVACSEVPLWRGPEGGIDKTLVYGEPVTVIEDAPTAFVQSGWDGYVGYVPRVALAAPHAATHRVIARGSQIYSAPDIKAPPHLSLPLGAEVEVLAQQDSFAQVPQGFVPRCHLAPLSRTVPFLQTLQALIGTPYLWGGGTQTGIDCSGLIQLGMRLAGHACPRDSDQQQSALGAALAPDAQLRPGDLVFWKGHVGAMLNPRDLIHANAHHMAVAVEPLAEARARIAANEFGEVTALRRVAGL